MDVQTLKRAASGDADAILTWRSWASALEEQEARQLDEALQELLDGFLRDLRERFWQDLVELKAKVNSTPALTAYDLERMENRARALGICESVQVLGLRSAKNLLLGELGAAEDNLRIAWDLTPTCCFGPGANLNPCQLYLHRRQGILEAALGRPESGLAHVQTALDGFRLGIAGHDINGDGEATCLYARAEIRFELKDYLGSVSDLTTCLDRFPINSKIWMRVQQDLAMVLSRTGSEGREMAYRMLARQRLCMRSRGDTVERATFLWTDGQLTVCLGKQRGLKKLKDSLNCFASLGMPHHFIGVAHDIARVLFPRREEIREFLDEVKPTVLALVRDRRHAEFFNEIYDLVKDCPTPRTLPRLDGVLRLLRTLVTEQASLPPYLLTSVV